ncbi:hypothetical protein lerEdw1_009681 [Lerista edwardsae]|nr:hypothetical protein lerEdw1_009681 [Lerista edwardsae]
MDSWAWTSEEEPPFAGLPPLPKVFREPSLPPSSLPETKGQEETEPVEGRSSSGHQDRLARLHSEMGGQRWEGLDYSCCSPNLHHPHSVQGYKKIGEGRDLSILLATQQGAPGIDKQRELFFFPAQLKLRLIDVGLFNQLYSLALEIQDLKELQQETENFFKEELLPDETSQARGRSLPNRTHSAVPFELTI